MKTTMLSSMTLFLLVGCNIEDPVPRLELSPMAIAQTTDGPIFSFDEKVHDFVVWRCTQHCEATFSDGGCGYDVARLVWSSSVAEDRDFSKTGARDAEAPITGPIRYGKKPETAPFSIEPVPPLVDGFYVALGTRYENACEDRVQPCWHVVYEACSRFKVEGDAITTPLLSR